MTAASGAAAEKLQGLANRPAAGIACVLIAIGLFTTVDMVVKLISPDVGTGQILLFRMSFGMIAMVPMLAFEARSWNWLPLLKTRRLPMHLLRSAVTLSFLALYFVSVILLPLADAFAVSFATPLWVAALSVPLLGERVGMRRWAAIGVGLIGVMIILRPGGGVLSAGGLAGLAATLLLALSFILVRTMSRTESASAIVFYYQFSAALCLSALLAAGWLFPAFGAMGGGFFDWTTPGTGMLWALLIGQGIFGGVGQVFINMAFRLAPAVVVSPFTYSSILWGLVYGFVLFGDIPAAVTLLGAAIVIASGIYTAVREARVRRAAANSPSGS